MAGSLCTAFFAVVGLSSVCSGAGKKTMRIAVATFSHETCTFAPKPTTIEDWEYFGPPTADIIDTVSGYIGGFRRMCDEFGSVELIGITSPRRVRGGSSGSWNTTEAFDKYTNLMAEDLKKAGHLNGLFLALHGAMAVTGIPKPEAEVVRRLRNVVGSIPITIHVGGYSDKFAGNPVEINGKVEFLGEYGADAIVVLHFGKNNRIILTPTLRQVVNTGIFAPLGINFKELDIIVLKSRVHFRRGYH